MAATRYLAPGACSSEARRMQAISRRSLWSARGMARSGPAPLSPRTATAGRIETPTFDRTSALIASMISSSTATSVLRSSAAAAAAMTSALYEYGFHYICWLASAFTIVALILLLLIDEPAEELHA